MFSESNSSPFLPRQQKSVPCWKGYDFSYIFYKQFDSLQNQKQTEMYFGIFLLLFIKLEKIGIFPKLSYQVSKYESLISFTNVL